MIEYILEYRGGFLRVISGEKKGFRLKAPKGMDTRPTEDRVKESLFNILGPIPNDSVILDLFAGSGSIGIEFLSRGAAKAYFVDNSPKSISVIKENLSHTGFLERAKIIKGDAIRTVKFLGRKGIKLDYIYIDPPFNKKLIKKALDEIKKGNISNNNGIIIMEHEKELSLSEEFSNFRKSDARRYGNKALTFYTYIGEE